MVAQHIKAKKGVWTCLRRCLFGLVAFPEGTGATCERLGESPACACVVLGPHKARQWVSLPEPWLLFRKSDSTHSWRSLSVPFNRACAYAETATVASLLPSSQPAYLHRQHPQISLWSSIDTCLLITTSFSATSIHGHHLLLSSGEREKSAIRDTQTGIAK